MQDSISLAAFVDAKMRGLDVTKCWRRLCVNMGQALRPFFSDLIAQADGLTRALDPSLSRFGSALYTYIFQVLWHVPC